MLRTPGPTTCPPEVLAAMSKQMTGFSDELAEAITASRDGIKNILESPFSEVYVALLAASGTGAMEAAVSSFLSPGDRVNVYSCGTFGDRFAEIALAFGLNVQLCSRPPGYGFRPDEFTKDFARSRKIFGEPKAVFITHNETSTGVTNPVCELAKIVRENSGALVIVDAISSFAITPLKMNAWNIDVVVGGVQKGLMTPPGLSFVAFNEYAKQAYERSTMPHFYFDLGKYISPTAKVQMPFTPAIPQIMALKEAIGLIHKEGTAVYERHKRLAAYFRKMVNVLGLEILAKEYFSDGVTAIKVPDGLKADDIIRVMKEDFGIIIAGGPGELAGKIIRIGHMGYFASEDISNTFYALERTLIKLRNVEKLL